MLFFILNKKREYNNVEYICVLNKFKTSMSNKWHLFELEVGLNDLEEIFK